MHDPDPAPHFAALFVLLETAVARRDYEHPDITAAIDRGAQSARAGGVLPERVLAYLRPRLHDAPLSAVGDWYRGVLVDRMILRAIEAYFAPRPEPGDVRDANEVTPDDDGVT